MIQVFKGDVLKVNTGIIVHGCNCQGVMGSGIARSIREQFPKVFEVYRDRFEREGLALGNIESIEVGPSKFIVNANTQHLYGIGERRVSYDAIAECFEKVNKLAFHIEDSLGVALPVVFPAIGAGLGGGDWEIIERIIDRSVGDHFQKILYVF